MMKRFYSYHFTLLQLEGYEITRYLKAAVSRYLPPKELRQTPVWTMKLRAIGAISLAYAILSVFIGYRIQGMYGALIGVIFSEIALPLLLALATLTITPLDIILKWRIIAAAKRKLAEFPNLIVIGIAGSYGKTTMKLALGAVLKERYEVLVTEDSVNTPVGIARFVLEKLSTRTEVLVLEMGEYRKGDIAELCGIASPDIAVLTGINEAHLERFGTLENTIATIFEIVDHAKEGAFVALNADDANVMRSYASHVHKKKVALYGASEASNRSDYAPEGNMRTSQDGLEQSFIIRSRKGVSYETRTALLGSYAPGVIACAIAVAEHLGMTHEEILRGIAMIHPAPHRLEPFLASGNILVIDDSYNGNPKGARAAIDVLGSLAGRRKIYCTPGLVEMGTAEKEVHEEIGRRLARTADLVILIGTRAADHIVGGLRKEKYPESSILRFKSAHEAHAALPRILRSGDAILFQNDWPDNYF